MKPKDLLQYLEKGDRSMEDLGKTPLAPSGHERSFYNFISCYKFNRDLSCCLGWLSGTTDGGEYS
jgi:hypothetical protein